jgi:hypothetical protein
VERAVLGKYNLWDVGIFEEPSRFDGTLIFLPLKFFVDPASPFERAFDTPSEARNFANKLKDEHLPLIKRIVESNTYSGSTVETFEL